MSFVAHKAPKSEASSVVLDLLQDGHNPPQLSFSHILCYYRMAAKSGEDHWSSEVGFPNEHFTAHKSN
jgi:hypothetical protein